MEPHQRVRINVLLGLDEDLSGAGYNVHQSEIAIGSGGLKGKGFLNGTQTKLKFVPEQDTDFIFCTVGEEEGFLGSAGVLLLFLALILRLIHLAERQTFKFGRIYGYSILSIFLFHFEEHLLSNLHGEVKDFGVHFLTGRCDGDFLEERIHMVPLSRHDRFLTRLSVKRGTKL